MSFQRPPGVDNGFTLSCARSWAIFPRHCPGGRKLTMPAAPRTPTIAPRRPLVQENVPPHAPRSAYHPTPPPPTESNPLPRRILRRYLHKRPGMPCCSTSAITAGTRARAWVVRTPTTTLVLRPLPLRLLLRLPAYLLRDGVFAWILDLGTGYVRLHLAFSIAKRRVDQQFVFLRRRIG